MSKLITQDDKPSKLKGGKKKMSKANKDIGAPKVTSPVDGKMSKKLSANTKQALDTFGTNNIDIINIAMHELTNTLPVVTNSTDRYINAALATAHELKPRDSYERMLVEL